MGPGIGAGGRAVALHRAALCPFSAYAIVGHALCRDHAWPAVERVRPCQGYLDQQELGCRAKTRRLFLAGDLHERGAAAAARPGAGTRPLEAGLSRARLCASAVSAAASLAARWFR